MKTLILKITLIGAILASLIGLLPIPVFAQSVAHNPLHYPSSFALTAPRHSWYCDGYWVVFIEDTTAYYAFSADGTTWGARQTMVNNITTADSSRLISVWFDGTYVHYIADTSISATQLTYRMGTPNSSTGAIDWEAAEQQITIAGKSNNHYSICVDTNGYPWIAHSYSTNGVYIYKSSTKDGTWTNDPTGYKLYSSNYYQPVILPLTSGKMAVVFSDYNFKIRVGRYSGGSWDTPATSTREVEYLSYRSYFSATVQDDIVHIAYLEHTTYDVRYVQWQYNSFSADTLLQLAAESDVSPTICIDTTSNSLHIFWVDEPTNDVVYYIEYYAPEAAWTDVYVLVDESAGSLLPTDSYCINTSSIIARDNIGIYYAAGGNTHDSAILKFKLLGEPFVIDTLNPSGVGDTYATLRGEIVSLSFGLATKRGFYLNTSGNLTGAVEYSETGSFNTGTYDSGSGGILQVTGLVASTTYYYVAFAENEFGLSYALTDDGYLDWVEFTTAFGSPSYLNAVPISSSEIALYWEYTGNVAGHCITIRRDEGGYPTNMLDGAMVLNKVVGSEVSDTHNNSGLASGTSYYYTLWLYDCTYGTAGGNVSDWATTFASGSGDGLTDPETGLPYPVPTMPAQWFQEPSCSMYGQIPFMSWIDGVADSFTMPEESLCLAITFMSIIAASFIVFKLIPLAGLSVIVAGVLIVVASIAGAMPMYFIALGIVLMGGSLFLWNRT